MWDLCGDDGNAAGFAGLCRRFSLNEGVITLLLISSPLTWCLSMMYRTADVAQQTRLIVCRSDGRIIAARPGADVVALIQSRKPCSCGHYRARAAISSEQIMVAMQNLPMHQKLNIETRAVHARRSGISRAASCLARGRCRHNALDKAFGALARGSVVARRNSTSHQPGSVEMVQKSAAIGPSNGVVQRRRLCRSHAMQQALHLPPLRARRIRSVHASYRISWSVACRLSAKAPLTVHNSNKWVFDYEDWNRWCGGKVWLCMCARGCGSRSARNVSSWMNP